MAGTDPLEAPAVIDQTRTFRVEEERLQEARDIVAKVNRKAARYGLAGYSLTVSELQHENVKRYGEVIGTRGYFDVELVGEMPRFKGWSFVATLDYEDAGVVTRPVPGVTVDLSAHRARPAECDYCGKRRERVGTFVFLHTDGSTKQVGRTCLQPFAGLSVSGLAWLSASLDELEAIEERGDREERGTREPTRFYVGELLRTACEVEQVEGYRSRAGATFGKSATVDLVTAILCGRSKNDDELRAHVAAGADTAKATEKAAAVRAYARELEGFSEYVENLRTLAAGDTVTWRNAALLVSAVGSYNKDQGLQIERKAQAAAVHVGTVKGKITLTGEVVTTRRVAGYGYRSPDKELVIVRGEVDGQPALIKWWASIVTGLEVGQTVTGTATVKAHEVYEGKQETVVIRAKLTPAA